MLQSHLREAAESAVETWGTAEDRAVFPVGLKSQEKECAGGGGGNVSPPCSEQGSIALCKLNNVRFGYFWHFGRCVEMMDFMLFVEPDTDLHSVQKMNAFRFNH